MKVAIINDTHAGIRKGSQILINYQRKFYEEIFFPYLKKNNIRRIIHLGDVFDNRKSIDIQSLDAYQKMFLDVIAKEQYRVDMIPGNHDIYYNNCGELNSLDTLLRSYFPQISVHHRPVIVQELKIGLVPWIQEKNYDESVEFINRNSDRVDILMGHFDLSGYGGVVGLGKFSKSYEQSGYQYVGNLSKYDLVLSGHYHSRSLKNNIFYLGANFQMTFNDADEQKYFHIFDTVERSVESIQNPLTLFERIIYNDRKFNYDHFTIHDLQNKFVELIVEARDNLTMFEQFLNRLNKMAYQVKLTERYQLASVEQKRIDHEICSELSTSELIEQYIANITTHLDRDRLNYLLQDLYKQAVDIDKIIEY